jgi:hypothetical protein
MADARVGTDICAAEPIDCCAGLSMPCGCCHDANEWRSAAASRAALAPDMRKALIIRIAARLVTSITRPNTSTTVISDCGSIVPPPKRSASRRASSLSTATSSMAAR